MTTEYTIVRDINGYRVIFHTIPSNYDTPQHASPEAAARWAEEILALEESGQRLLAAK